MWFVKARFWKLTLLGGAVAVASWLGWSYADRQQPTLVAVNTTTGKLQWVYPLSDDFGYSKGPIAGNGKVVLDGCLKTTDDNCGAYQIQAFDAQSGKLLWHNRPSGSFDPYKIASNQAAIVQTDRLYLQLERELQSIDLATGAQQWQIPRQWFYRNGGSWYGMGAIDRPDKLAILKIDRRTRLLQTLDPKTGKLRQQATITIPNLATTLDKIAANDRSLFLETSGLVPANTPGSFHHSGTSTVTAYDSQTLQPRFRTDIKGNIFAMKAIDKILLINNYAHNDVKTKKTVEGNLVGMNADTGQVLWQKKPSQLNCDPFKHEPVDIDTVYLNCRRSDNFLSTVGAGDNRIVALSIQTGAVKWQTQLSSGSSDDLPATVGNRQYLAIRRVSQANTQPLQTVALDRQTGKLLWAFPLFDRTGTVDTFRSIVAAEGDRFFTLDRIPRWQLWLLQVNPS
jgi:outer membrane protein assembly factor BamB